MSTEGMEVNGAVIVAALMATKNFNIHQAQEYLDAYTKKAVLEATKLQHAPSREDAVKFAEAIAASDTGLGGWLQMSNGVESFASLLMQFANPIDWYQQLTNTEAHDK